MRFKNFCSAALLTFVLFAPLKPAPSAFLLHNGDTVVFYGDSITDQRLYTMLTEFFVVTRYPNLNVTFVDSGWGGDRVSGGSGGAVDVRLERDVLAYHPSFVTVMLGMNDGDYTNHKPASDTAYKDGYKHIIETLRQAVPNERIEVIAPSPYDDVTRPSNLPPDGYNAVLQRYGEWLATYAREQKLYFTDLNGPVVAMLRKANSENPVEAQKIIPDRIHPALAGHLIMAEQLIRSWFPRPIISSVTIDAKRGKVTQADWAKITDFHPSVPLLWTQTDDSLPLPLANLLANDRDHTLALAIKNSDIVEALNQQPLRVIGLPATGSYRLTVDGDAYGPYTSSDLGKGINLAALDTPMSRQAIEVRDLTVRRLEIHQQQWRAFQVGLSYLALPHLDDTVKAINILEKEVAVRQRAAAQPMPHVFQVTPVP